MSSPSIFIVGAGPQIAASVAHIFASNGFSVGLASRSQENLDRYTTLLPDGTRVATAVADALQPKTCVSALNKLAEELGAPSIVLFNAGSLNLGAKPIMEMSLDDMRAHNEANIISGFAVIQWAIANCSNDFDTKLKRAVFITGGGLSLQPRPGRAGLAAGKAALLNLAEAFRVETEGIHIATVIVKGFVDKGDPFYTSTEIAKEYWRLYTQNGGEWQFVVEH